MVGEKKTKQGLRCCFIIYMDCYKCHHLSTIQRKPPRIPGRQGWMVASQTTAHTWLDTMESVHASLRTNRLIRFDSFKSAFFYHPDRALNTANVLSHTMSYEVISLFFWIKRWRLKCGDLQIPTVFNELRGNWCMLIRNCSSQAHL